MDLAIGRLGLTALHGYWKSREHQLRESMLHFQLGRPLVNKNCAGAPRREQKRQRVEGVLSADKHLCLAYTLGVDDMLAVESVLELLWWRRSWMKTYVRC